MEIFVVVGTQKFPFDRLVRKADSIASKNKNMNFYIQRGCSKFIPRHSQSSEYLTPVEFAEKLAACDVVVCHAGVGIISEALHASKCIVAVPRLKKYNEHVDDHQCEILEFFSSNGRICSCRSLDSLEEIIMRSFYQRSADSSSETESNLVKEITKYISRLSEQKEGIR